MSAIELEIVGCPLGCNPQDKLVLHGHDLLHGLPGEFSVVCCTTCGLKRTSPRPTPEAIGLYYPEDYGPYKGTQVINDGDAVAGLKQRFISFAKRIFDTKAQAVPSMRPGRMLEIGCASGSYLRKMANYGWQVDGIEYSPTAAQCARALGYNVDIGALETIEKPADSYDLIVGWMVLEHLHQPVQSLRKLSSWARSDARLVVSVPNAGSFGFKLFGKRWHALHLPNHLFHFDPDTVQNILKAGGWEVERIQHHRNLGNFVGSLGYLLCDHGFTTLGLQLKRFPERGGRIGALLLFPLALPLAWFGQTGGMTVWSKKATKC